MHLNPDEFNAHLNDLGQLFGWRPSFVCPCSVAGYGSADPECPNCLGRGHIWEAEQQGMSGIAGMKIQRQWADFGGFQAGDVVLTIPSDSPLYDIGDYDRATMLNSSEPFSFELTRGGNDKLWFTAVSIRRVFWLDENKAIVDGGIPDVDCEGNLTWAYDEPPVGTMYSITGRRLPEYFCYQDFPQDRAHHSGARLPRKVVLRKFDLLGRVENGA
ncbi:hypothetical protein [Pseudomonas sp.]|uniref:hypothetical protein n=1 Tax=Pseudomonas sp. TaxID=306 RepID=UPI002589B1AB|nr:hypothetical protein [Pseudomonas sp.]